MAAERCPTCEADVVLGSPRCWLCGDELPVLAEAVAEPKPAPGDAKDWVLHAGLWLAALAILLLILGLLQLEQPYYALALAILTVPALAISFGGAALGRLLDKPWHPAVKIAVGVAVAVVLFPVAAFIALCVACFDALGGFRGGP